MSRTSIILSCLLLCGALSANDQAAQLARAWSAGSQADAEQAARQVEPELRLAATRALLQSSSNSERKLGLRLAERLWLHALLPELQQLPRTESLCAKLALYGRFAIEREPASLATTPAEAAAAWFVSYQVQVQARDSAGRPLSGGRLRAYSHDYDISLPVAEASPLDADGQCALRLPAGEYTLFAASAERADPVLVRSGRLTVGSDLNVQLDASHSLPCRLEGADTPSDTRLELAPTSHPFLSFGFQTDAQTAIEISAGLQLRAQLLGKDTQGAFFLLGQHDPQQLAFDLEACAQIAWHSPAEGIDALRWELRLGGDGLGARQLDLKRGDALRISAGACDVGYSYEHPELERLSFQRRAYSLEQGQLFDLSVGGPLQPRVWASLYEKRYQKLAPFAVRAFLLDAQGHVLSSVQQSDRRRNGTRLLRVEILRAGESIHSLRRSYADLEATLAGASIEDLRYRIISPLPLLTDEVSGEGAARFGSERYSISAPAFLEAEAQTFLAAAETIYQPLREVALRKLKWKQGKINIHPSMPAGVRAYASSNGTSNFNVYDLLRCTRLRDALGSTPIFHEHLHTVGYSHSDYMDVAGLRVRRALDPQGAAFMGRGKNPAKALQFLLEGSQGKGGILARLLLQRYGAKIFDGYLARRKQRVALQARGLSEKESDCALFSDVCGEDLSALFATVHAGIDAEDVEAGLAEPDADSESGQNPSGGFGFADLKRALADEQADISGLLADWQAKIGGVPALRAQARHFLRLGELLFLQGREDDACRCFSKALQAAVDIDAGFFARTRNEALGVLRGEPLGLGWM